MRLFALALVIACVAPAARAQVAIAPLIQGEDAVHRDIVGEVALAVAEAHALHTPPLSVGEIAKCRDDVACVLGAARTRGASHVVLVSVAPLGARDQVVAVSLYDVGTSAKLFEENAVLTTTRDVRADARAIGARLAAVPGLPPPRSPVADPPASGPVHEPGVLTYAGVALVAVGGVAAIGTAIAASAILAQSGGDPRLAGTVIIAGTLVTLAGGAGGVTLLLVDGALSRPADAAE